MIKLKAAELRTTKPTEEQLSKIKRRDIYFILDNVLDTYNVGGIFRLADALGVKKVYLCGDTETPPNPRIKKASINTTEWVAWEYCEKTEDAIEKLRKEVPGIQIVAVEQDKRSTPYTKIEYKSPFALLVGNETTGSSRNVLDLCDDIAEIPMWGVNVSLNVIISLGIASFEAVSKLNE